MSIATEPATQIPAFDASDYDLEGTPTLNGRKAEATTVSFESFDLDITDSQHMHLAGLIRKGGTFSITVTAKVAKAGWTERESEAGGLEVERRMYRLTIRDIVS